MAKKTAKKDIPTEEQVNPAVEEQETPAAEQARAEPQPQAEDAALAKALLEKEEYLNALIRERADFDNYKKRNATAVARAYTDGKLDAAAKVLPVLDNLERALGVSVAENENAQAIIDGVKMIEKQLIDVLAAMDIHEIEAQGKPFDPNLHNAVMQEEAGEGEESGMVKEVLMKGYMTADRVLRHSMVKVTQ
ncbi:MAG: nucleotide exchange factor GrpE [Christensenellaceae bacterium]|nr:nucleotide exchange factor GrpE [Christensenellaceae bacterium]